ncbi:hypothetical protein Acr_04g0001620 [Actinidia rufa]|uniref:Uncharacterized protein n=1 Tax=Actinidia rufa TaxID=165716 RepID=A0A7J0EG24_9ERIC|nr:hypothetical protein Acr_04g0001620 [Actinidia rufa]
MPSRSPSGYVGCQKKLQHASHLMSPDISWDHRRSLPLVQAIARLFFQASLIADSLEIMTTLARSMPMFGSVCMEPKYIRVTEFTLQR